MLVRCTPVMVTLSPQSPETGVMLVTSGGGPGSTRSGGAASLGAPASVCARSASAGRPRSSGCPAGVVQPASVVRKNARPANFMNESALYTETVAGFVGVADCLVV